VQDRREAVRILSDASGPGEPVASVAAGGPTVAMMCGLPASGKTTTAGRLHAELGGVLIRSCDVFQALGISLPEWVRRTRGFTVDVDAYDRVRDQAYEEMARRLDAALGGGPPLVVVDAVHGEPVKRAAVYAICLARGATPVLLHCRCDDPAEVARRFRGRHGREDEPPNEASDLSVFRDIARRWTDPAGDRLPDGRSPTVISYDTRTGVVAVRAGAEAPGVDRVLALLGRARDREGREPLRRA
jgi:predicted kinase